MYHISQTPNLAELEPRVPHLAGLEEPLTPRVCAAPTIPGCLYGLVELEDNTKYYVYEIAAAPDVDNQTLVDWPGPFSVIDADISGEVWYTQPVPCNYLGPLGDLCDPTDELNWRCKMSNEVRRCTECGRPLTAEECFEIPEERMCDECAGHVILPNKILEAKPFVYDPSDFADLAEYLITGGDNGTTS